MTITFDTTDWTHEQVNLIPAAIEAILFERGTEHETVDCVGNACQITGLVGDIEILPADILKKQEEQEAYRQAHPAVIDEPI